MENIDLLSLVRDKLSPDHKTRLTAALSIDRMVRNLQGENVGIDVQKGDMNAEPVFIYTAFVERDGKPYLTSTLFLGTIEKEEEAKPIVMLLRREHDGTDWLLQHNADPENRAHLTPWGAEVFDAISEMLDEAQQLERAEAPQA